MTGWDTILRVLSMHQHRHTETLTATCACGWASGHADHGGYAMDRHLADVLSESIDWRVLGGLVPGIIDAAWLRKGDRVRVASIEGTVTTHTVHTTQDVARFVVRTDGGAEVAFERWRGSEIHVIAAEVNRG